MSSTEELDLALIKAGVVDRHAWRETTLNGIARLLTKNPLRYRAYGPFWWSIKRMLTQQGFKFDSLNQYSNQYLYLDDDYNLAAGVLLATDWATQYFGVNEFTLLQDDEFKTYVLEDAEMEVRYSQCLSS